MKCNGDTGENYSGELDIYFFFEENHCQRQAYDRVKGRQGRTIQSFPSRIAYMKKISPI